MVHRKQPNFTLVSILSGLLLLSLFLLLLKLGFWQLDRANWKRQLLLDHATRAEQPALTLSQVLQLSDPSFYPVKLVGEFDSRHITLIDNQYYQHQNGYRVLVPFKPVNKPNWLLVERGWLPRSEDVEMRVNTLAADGQVRLQGEVKPDQPNQFMVGDWQVASGWPAIVQSIDVKRVAEQLKRPLYPFVVRLQPQDPLSFVQLETLVTIPPEKHISYAMTWFGLAIALCLGYISVRWKRRSH